MANLKGLVNWLLVISYGLLIFAQSSRPVPDSLSHADDKLLHFAGYALMAVLACHALKSSFLKRYSAWTVFVTGALIASLYGASDEIHQYFIPHRDASLLDLWADIAGGIFGAGLYCLLGEKRGMFQK